MEQYLQALKKRETIDEDTILELEERFKEPEQEVFERGLTEIEQLKISQASQFEMLLELIMLGGEM